MKIAKYLESHPKIEKVLYPGLPSHPHYEIAQKNKNSDKHSGGSGMLSFYLKGDINAAIKITQSLKLITLAESLGDVTSLINHPAAMTHRDVPPDVRKKLGIDDNFLRLSIGCEDIDDIMKDLDQALDQIDNQSESSSNFLGESLTITSQNSKRVRRA